MTDDVKDLVTSQLVMGRCWYYSQVKLVVAKCWDASPRGYFLPPHGEEPVRPIDPSAWVAHTEAVRQEAAFAGQTSSFGLMPPFGQSSSVDTSPINSSISSHESRMFISCCLVKCISVLSNYQFT